MWEDSANEPSHIIRVETSGNKLSITYTCLSPWWCHRNTVDSLQSWINQNPHLRKAGWFQSSWSEATLPGCPRCPKLMILMKQGVMQTIKNESHATPNQPPTSYDCGHQKKQFRIHFFPFIESTFSSINLVSHLLVPWWQMMTNSNNHHHQPCSNQLNIKK